MKPGEEHVIPCVDVSGDTMTVAIGTDHILRISIDNRLHAKSASHYLNRDTARQLFALLGNYLHTFPTE